MALFYPATFGIVGQKMTTLQHRSQGDPEDPHDEHYLLATQSKQEQVRRFWRERRRFCPCRRSWPVIDGSVQSLPSDRVLKLILF